MADDLKALRVYEVGLRLTAHSGRGILFAVMPAKYTSGACQVVRNLQSSSKLVYSNHEAGIRALHRGHAGNPGSHLVSEYSRMTRLEFFSYLVLGAAVGIVMKLAT
jgi:hypothetical protein